MYVDAHYDRNKDVVNVVERVDGKRVYKTFPAKYILYYPDTKGKFTSIYGSKLSKVETSSRKTFNTEKRNRANTFESDINTTIRCLSENYANSEIPKLNVLFFDIEVDFNRDLGFAPPSDPFNPITAISLYLGWLGKMVSLVIKPDTLTTSEAAAICSKFPNCFLMDTEAELLSTFLSLIDDADMLSGWNSEGFDIPYTINRVARVLGKDYTRMFCLWDKYPKKRMYESYGTEQETYDLIGKVHLDYLQLYRKYTYHEMHSYSLDAIAEAELGEHKVAYEGTLDALYNNDFEKFIGYSIQDTMLLKRIDDKLQFIDQANMLAHANTVAIPTTMGAVAQTDSAIINEAHSMNLIVPDKRHKKPDIAAAGAYVAIPVTGLHKWIGSTDLNSLYPSILRACNMSPETIIGQIRHTITSPGIAEYMDKYKDGAVAKYWDGKFACREYELVLEKNKDIILFVDYEDGLSVEMTGAEIYSLVFENKSTNWALSSNGTLFTFDKPGIIPGLLARWYEERKVMQRRTSVYGALATNGIEIPDAMLANENTATTMEIPDDIGLIGTILESGTLADLDALMRKFKLVVDAANNITAIDTDDAKEKEVFWDKRQLIRKINLNSLYGALLNPGSRFFDQRLGQSTTLVGRTIARHMAASINECITGEYDHLGKAIIYGDTDSVDQNTNIFTQNGMMKISKLYEGGTEFWENGSKEYSNSDLQIMHVNTALEEEFVETRYIYRHRVSKPRYSIKTEDGNEVIVTADHSIMVLEDGKLVEKKATELTSDDVLIAVD
jgi:DNA polymerase elongation subunit (family B)